MCKADKQRKLRRLLACVLSGTMLFTSNAYIPEKDVSAASVCTVNTSKTYQIIRGFGGMNLPEWQGYDLTSSQIQTVFGNGDNELGLTVLRIFVSDNSNDWSKAVPTAKGAQKLGATVFATPWNPPSSMRQSGSGGRTGGKYVLKNGSEAAYAQHLNNYIKYMEGQGISLYSVSVQNEPDCSSDWTHWSPDRIASFIANYGQAVKQGTKAKLMSAESFQYSPESTGFGKMYYKKVVQNQAAMKNLDLFGTHFYGTQRSQMDYPTVENSGKEIWMTEVYVPNSDTDSANRFPEAIKVAENIHNGLVVGNMSAYVWWYIRRSYSLIGQNDGKPTKRGYMMAQYSKYVRPGDIRIDATESPANNVLISAYKHSDTQIEIVAINQGSSELNQQFSVNGRTITNVDRYRTGANENLAKSANMNHETSTFNAQLPANSVSTFVLTLESDGIGVPADPNAPVPAEPIKPDANGYYYHDTFENGTDSWEARGSSELTISGRHPYQGTNALLVQNREKAWNGVQKNLDTVTFKPGEKYSFSVCVDYEDGAEKQDFLLSLAYKDASGETKFAHIAEGTTYPGQYLQLKNESFQIPDGAENPVLYVETADSTDNFYIDEAIVAKDGTQIAGPEPPVEPVTDIPGDVNDDGEFNAEDIIVLQKWFLDDPDTDLKKSESADLNKDNVLNISDLCMMKSELLKDKEV